MAQASGNHNALRVKLCDLLVQPSLITVEQQSDLFEGFASTNPFLSSPKKLIQLHNNSIQRDYDTPILKENMVTHWILQNKTESKWMKVFVRIWKKKSESVQNDQLGVLSAGSDVDWSATCVVYVWTNKWTGQQYVGKTTQTMRDRTTQHIVAGVGKAKPTSFLFHECLRVYPPVDGNWSIRVIGSFDSKLLCHFEAFWIKTLNTLWPHGLNINVRHHGLIDHRSHDPTVRFWLASLRSHKKLWWRFGHPAADAQRQLRHRGKSQILTEDASDTLVGRLVDDVISLCTALEKVIEIAERQPLDHPPPTPLRRRVPSQRETDPLVTSLQSLSLNDTEVKEADEEDEEELSGISDAEASDISDNEAPTDDEWSE